ncbi:MAG: DsbA family oxidoreductase [Crocinitomicaceae bacterium]|nr:MAG: DsbA family oxidoreductase [Crocinitomicaceae bacterium]
MEKGNKLKIEIWSDVMCPFCYIGKRRIENALDQFPNKEQVEIEWKSFQLDPSTKSQPGKSTYDYLAERYGRDRQWSVEMHNNIAQQAKADGLEYNFDKAVIANSFDAHRLSHLAKKHGVGNALEELIFKAYFTEGKDVADQQTLIELGVAVGLDASEITAMLQSDLFADAVQGDIAEAQQLGVRGVPFFVMDRKYAVSGAQPLEVFTETLQKSWDNWEGKSQFQTVESAAGAVCTPDGNCN